MELVFLHPVPNGLNAVPPFPPPGGVPHQQALPQRGAEGVHHEKLPLRILLPQLAVKDLGGHLPVVGPVLVILPLEHEGQREHLKVQLPHQLVGQVG